MSLFIVPNKRDLNTVFDTSDVQKFGPVSPHDWDHHKVPYIFCKCYKSLKQLTDKVGSYSSETRSQLKVPLPQHSASPLSGRVNVKNGLALSMLRVAENFFRAQRNVPLPEKRKKSIQE